MRDSVTMPELRGFQKLPLSPALQIPSDRGFHVNLLAHSLTSKLKLQRKSDGKSSSFSSHERNVLAESATNCESINRRVTKSILARRERRRHLQEGLSTQRSDAAMTDTSTVKGESSRSNRKQSLSGRVRVDSAASDHLPSLSGKMARRDSSRRSTSASPVAASTSRHGRPPGRHATPSDRSHSEMAFMYTGSELSGVSPGFETPGPGHSVMVVKRDGVFQPLDKYAPPRQVLREMVPVRKGAACEYEVYNICDGYDEMGASTKNQEDPRRALKVSWSKATIEVGRSEEDGLGGDGDERPAPTPASTIRRAVSVDNFAFRKPVYISGRSRVASIGVKWSVPSVDKEGEKTKEEAPPKPKVESSRKPMWSWLITNEVAPPSAQKSRGAHSAASAPPLPPGSMKQSSKSVGSNNSVVMKHCRDLHPVATAMDREGTSVSRTKWHVPSSTSSTLEAERAIYGRLELVKKPGSQLLYECPTTIRAVGTESRGLNDASTERKKCTRTINQSDDKHNSNRDQEHEVDDGSEGSEYSSSGSGVGECPSSPAKSRMTEN